MVAIGYTGGGLAKLEEKLAELEVERERRCSG